MKMQVGGYQIDLLVEGFPGRSVYHGGIGWSSVILLRGHGRVALLDTGHFGMRNLLINELKARDLSPADVTDLILSHSHWDHSVNWPLFAHARIVIGAVEMAWCRNVPPGRTPVPEACMKELESWPTLEQVEVGAEVLPGVFASLSPGHTPGHLMFRLSGEDHDVLFVQDAAKTRGELITGRTDMTYDAKVSEATIARIWELWRERPGTVLIAGHDLPMVLKDGVPSYVGERRAAIRGFFGDDLETSTVFDLSAPAT